MNEYWFTAFYEDRDGWAIEFKYSVKAASLSHAIFKGDELEKRFEKENSWLHNFDLKENVLDKVEEL